ncbi:MAG: Cyclopropane-fatty-acyl-phospholipid synthase, partial [Phenylobacterium sp.]|nr:Cyclopropane-fatty-acyl-phospholipid synthase [Phenylobacterium sp.]
MIDSVLGRMIKVGDLTLHLPGGQTKRAGDGTGAPVEARVNGRGLRRIVSNPSLGFGEAYMDGDLELLQGTCWDLLEIVGRSGARGPKGRGNLFKRTSKA